MKNPVSSSISKFIFMTIPPVWGLVNVMKRLLFLFLVLGSSVLWINAQTISWSSIHPRALTNGTNTYSGGVNNGFIIVAESAQSCSWQSQPSGPCDSGDTQYGFADWHEDYTYSVVFYDANGNMLPTTLTVTNEPYVNCGPGHPEEIGYKKYSWTTPPGYGAIAYVAETVDVSHFQIYSAGNTECYYNQTITPGNPGYPLGSPFSGVLLGPLNNPLAIGTTDNDDYTNKSLLGSIVGTSTTTSQIISFQNTVRNKDSISDSAVITAPNIPSGFIVEASPNCSAYTTISGGGSITVSGIPGSSNATFCVRITAPSGIATFTPFSTLLRATSVNDPIKTNDTIDRIYTGFITTTKTATITNSTGVGGANDPVPGAVINYSIGYQNIANLPFGSGNYDLNATNFVITENGNLAPNNWGSFTNQVVGSGTDSNGGSINGDSAGSNLLTDTVPSLPASASGTFAFKRKIN